MGNFDFLDDLNAPEPAAPSQDFSLCLVVGAPAINSTEFAARCRRHEELARLNLPMIFELDNGELNIEDFPTHITTVVEAAKYIEDMQRPIIDKWAPVIEAAYVLGPNANTRVTK
jgi:hypothetical protein